MIALLDQRAKLLRIGLDIGACGIRAVQCRRTRAGYSVSSAAVLDIDSASDPEKRAENLPPAIRRCLALASFRKKEVAVALAPPDIEYFSIELPEPVLKSAGKEMGQVVRFEVDRLTTLDPTHLEVDFWSLGTAIHNRPNTMAVAANSQSVLTHIQACTEASLTCTCVDAEAIALSRVGARLHEFTEKDLWAILDLGSNNATLIVCVDNIPFLIRHVGSSGQRWTTRIAESLQISPKSAEIQKRDHGLPAVTRQASPAPATTSANVSNLILSAIRSDLNDMAAEIKRSYEYVLSCYPSRQARDLILVGGAAGTANIDLHLGDILGIQVRRASSYFEDPTCRLRPNDHVREHFDRCALAVGLSLEPTE